MSRTLAALFSLACLLFLSLATLLDADAQTRPLKKVRIAVGPTNLNVGDRKSVV